MNFCSQELYFHDDPVIKPLTRPKLLSNFKPSHKSEARGPNTVFRYYVTNIFFIRWILSRVSKTKANVSVLIKSLSYLLNLHQSR